MEHKRKNIFVGGPITAEKIATSIEKHSTKTGISGHSIYLRQVRAEQTEKGFVQAIEYTADEAAALEISDVIREEIFAKYPLVCAHVYQSLGIVTAGQISLFVFTSSEDRKIAIAACEELAERIERELPVFCKEIIDTEYELYEGSRRIVREEE